MVARPGGLWSVVAVLAVALATLAALSVRGGGPPVEVRLALDVSPVPLDGADPSRSMAGPLHYLGGLWLRSPDARFGGLSDLRVSANGARLFAASDCGYGFTASLSYDGAGRLVGLTDARIIDLAGVDGRPLPVGGSDAESLVLGAEGLEVGFEGRGKVLAYGTGTEPAFAGPARRLPTPAGHPTCGWNKGLEVMADTGDGRRLLICEGRRGASGTAPAWVGTGDDWTAREYPLLFGGGWAREPFRPTGATRLPDGDVVVLERRFPPMGARLVRLSRANLDGEGPLEPREVARLDAPLPVDNFEGVEARTDGSGRTLVYLLSDDNNCSKSWTFRRPGPQRTLLLLFALPG
jgi:hypothetical protein